jgi:hypothetical protein
VALDVRGCWDLDKGLYGGAPIRATILTFVELWFGSPVSTAGD